MDKSVQFQREIKKNKQTNKPKGSSDLRNVSAMRLAKYYLKKENVVIQNGKLTIGTANRLWLFISLVMNFALFFHISSYLHVDTF